MSFRKSFILGKFRVICDDSGNPEFIKGNYTCKLYKVVDFNSQNITFIDGDGTPGVLQIDSGVCIPMQTGPDAISQTALQIQTQFPTPIPFQQIAMPAPAAPAPFLAAPAPFPAAPAPFLAAPAPFPAAPAPFLAAPPAAFQVPMPAPPAAFQVPMPAQPMPPPMPLVSHGACAAQPMPPPMPPSMPPPMPSGVPLQYGFFTSQSNRMDAMTELAERAIHSGAVAAGHLLPIDLEGEQFHLVAVSVTINHKTPSKSFIEVVGLYRDELVAIHLAWDHRLCDIPLRTRTGEFFGHTYIYTYEPATGKFKEKPKEKLDTLPVAHALVLYVAENLIADQIPWLQTAPKGTHAWTYLQSV